VIHGEDDAAGGDEESDNGGDVHKFAILRLGSGFASTEVYRSGGEGG
jgi:hypothetical protein